MGNCPNDKFIHQSFESFGEQRYVTAEILSNFCRNDEYLYKMVEKLGYLTPPAIRKRFNPCLVDDANSFGYQKGTSENVVFSNRNVSNTYVDFSNLALIDSFMTTANIHSRLDDGQTVISAETPKQTFYTIDRTTKDKSPWPSASMDLSVNEYWYIGFDKNKSYHIQPNWLEGEEEGRGIYNTEIPAVGRAQTFKPNVSGYLEGITVNLKCDWKSNTGSPLLVQVRPTEMKNGVAYPVPYHYKNLAEQRVRFSNSTPNICTISFDHPPYLEKDKSYAIVFLSPLTHPNHAWWLGGWSKNCGADPYTRGDAFLTENNGGTWMRYGKGENVPYHLGKFAPVDFAFEMQIRQSTEEYVKNTDHYVYLKPIRTSPASGIQINAQDNSATDGVSIIYQVSNNGRDWFDLNAGNRLSFENHECMTFVRAKMKTTINTPAIINWIDVNILYDASSEMYVRTPYYYPKTAPMLGANVWGRVYAPFEVEPTVSCSAELISEREAIEHFTTINLNDLVYYTHLEEIDESAVVDKTMAKRCEYVESHPEVLEALKRENVYILPFVDSNEEVHYFFNSIELTNKVAYPILECTMQPISAEKRSIGEWYDFLFNYDNEKKIKEYDGQEHIIPANSMWFYPDVQNNMLRGDWTVKYNPIIIDGLSNSEIGQHTSDEDEGLVLDYFKESFVVDENNIETRTFNLRCSPADPVRKVVLNEEELHEDRDFVVDYTKQKIIIEPDVLKIDDRISVVYTPNIEDTGIAIGYYAKRENTRKQCFIKPNYLEYKV
ncbi:MAG: hypothetical protein Q4P18_07305 [Methanobrevibacter sp.]|uniref:hypothetical protein n=1 Tax=Methanobrevibacter sp. TaxID=66852 RepID=UPI0026E02B2E|nr:hypothetical protein [Methanobrevibacter sp.]MDO5849325.1 hypothetical protein [Methanobrevibacter sp.]